MATSVKCSSANYPCPSELNVLMFIPDSLSGYNDYKRWRQQMHDLIKKQGLVGFIDGTVKTPPKKVTDDPNAGGDHHQHPAVISGGGGGTKEIENEDYEAWKRSDELLQKWIRTTLTEDICKEVKLFKTAKGLWTKLEKMFGHYLPLHKAAIKGDWEMVNEYINQELHIAIRASITEDSETALIVAVKSKQRINFVKKLVEIMSPEDLAIPDTRNRTALHRAAGAGNIEAAKMLVNKNPYLPNAQTYDKRIPLFFAAARGNREMVLYLLSVTIDDTKSKHTNQLSPFLPHTLSNANLLVSHSQNQNLKDDGTRKGIEELRWNSKPFEGESGFRILHQLIISGFYDIALALLKDKPDLASFIPEKEKDLEFHSLVAIARKPSSFRSGTSFNFWQNFIYEVVPVKLEKNADYQSTGDVDNPADCFNSSGADGKAKKRLHAMFWKIAENLLPFIKHIREKKVKHNQARELVRFLCYEIAKSNYSKAAKIFSLPLVHATSVGILEIVEEILGSYPDAISLQNQKKQSIFQQAIVCRCEKVFNLIHQVGESKTIFLSQWDESKNNALHLAGYLAPQQQLYLRAGAALQMQRELQWFKEVENFAVPRNKEERNNEGKTPAEVFTETHKKLVKEGEQWMKGTASSCTIVAALIATVVFAAAITLPGGNDGSSGHPIFSKQAPFLVFIIFDAFALFSSITSVMLFLSILTSRYGEEDFLVSLPRRLMFGLITLFLSILSTMIAFGATLYLVFGYSYTAWIAIPIVVVLACIPVTLFAFLQFPLLVDMFKSTYRSIFLKESKGMLY